jgi:hypothetical protein
MRILAANVLRRSILVDAKDEGAAAFYRTHGFERLASRPLTLFLPLATALKLFS